MSEQVKLNLKQMKLTPKELALSLVKCESENQVINTLKENGYWDDTSSWRYFGDNENNFSIIGNQQSAPDSALVEKLINSIDAVLMRLCYENGMAPSSSSAPKSIQDALDKFLNIREGQLSNLDSVSRNDLAQNIILVATGEKNNPNYIILDKGEGQTPDQMPNTLMSINKSNKLRIPFVQGKHNMGGTGVFQFCGNNNLQLILTKRFQGIASDDKSKEYWGFTIVRREDPRDGKRSSAYTYLAPEGKVLRFKADELHLAPQKDTPYKKPVKWGTFIKLFEYKMPKYKTVISLNLYYRLSLLIANAGLPIRMIETRNYKGHTKETTLSGIKVRLYDDRSNNLEEGFPSSGEITVSGQKMPVSIYAFKKDKDYNYRDKSEGILFTLNGQTHGSVPTQFFTRNKVGMAYIAESILIIVDCNNLSARSKEDLFMNSRDRLREGSLKFKIEDHLEELVKNNAGLKTLRDMRRREALTNKIDDSKPIEDVLKSIINKSPTLASLLGRGVRISNPFNYIDAGEFKPFQGKRFPTYFELKNKSKNTPLLKQVDKDHRCRVQFITDVENEYFSRPNEPGVFELTVDGKKVEDYTLNLENGTANLTITLPVGHREGNNYKYEVSVSNDSCTEVFEEEFIVKVIKDKKKRKHSKDDDSDPKDKNKKSNTGLAIPEIIDVIEKDWVKHSFDRTSALKVVDNGENGYDFYINIDNIYLNTELKNLKVPEKIEYSKAKYRYGMALIGISILNGLNKSAKEQSQEGEETNPAQVVYDTTKMISPVLLPMINALAELDE